MLCNLQPAVLADSDKAPDILAASVITSTQPNQLVISGNGFGTVLPFVFLNGLALPVTNFTNTQVIAELPAALASSPGTYLLAVVNNSANGNVNNRTGLFEVAIGAIGLRGATEPPARRVQREPPGHKA